MLKRIRLGSISADRIKRLLQKTWKPVLLTLICFLAFYIRIQPLLRVGDLGFYLHEYDTYFQYRVTRRILEGGLSSWYNWYDTKSWYPYGRNIPKTSYPGLPIAGAIFYSTIEWLGFDVPLIEALVFFPPIMAILMCIAIFFLGRTIGGDIVGILSSLILAIAPGNVSRTFAGWYDDESVGILMLILAVLFYVKAIKTGSIKRSLLYGVLGGVSLGYMVISWGSSIYVLATISLSTLIILFVDFNIRVPVAYIPIALIPLAFAIQVPRLGYGFLRNPVSLASYVVIILSLLRLSLERFEKEKRSGIFLAVSAVLVVAGAIGVALGAVPLPTGKYLAVINPFYKKMVPLIRSVGEHQSTTWAQIFTSIGFLGFLIPFYLIYTVRRPSAEHIALAVWLLSSLYFTASFARLELLLAPAIAVAGAYMIRELSKPFLEFIRQPRVARVPRRAVREMNRGLALIVVSILLCSSFLPLSYFIYVTYFQLGTLPSILELSARYSRPYTDWLEALAWMRENLGGNAVVMSWWDYGYWITVLGNCTTLADNATLNTTQIATIAKMFLSPENVSIPLMKEYNVTHIVVFTSFTSLGGGTGLFILDGLGEEGKFPWMIRIADNAFGGFNETEYIDQNTGAPTSKFYESILGKIIPFRFLRREERLGVNYYLFKGFYESENLKPVFVSSSLKKAEDPNYAGWVGGVLIYKVEYGNSTKVNP